MAVSQNRESICFQNLSEFSLGGTEVEEIGTKVANQGFEVAFLPLPLSPFG